MIAGPATLHRTSIALELKHLARSIQPRPEKYGDERLGEALRHRLPRMSFGAPVSAKRQTALRHPAHDLDRRRRDRLKAKRSFMRS